MTKLASSFFLFFRPRYSAKSVFELSFTITKLLRRIGRCRGFNSGRCMHCIYAYRPQYTQSGRSQLTRAFCDVRTWRQTLLLINGE